MERKEVFFSGHAVQRMFERGVSAKDVLSIVDSGEVIANYIDDYPLPSCLILGAVGNRPLHVVLAIDAGDNRCFVITAYYPDPALWNADFRSRREP